jgi:hypothetical protein
MADTATPGSFIPHDTAVTPVRERKGGGLNDLLLLCGIVLLIASGALAVGVFLYEQLLQTQSASKVVQLQRAEAAFEPALVEQITRLDDRMNAADTILGAHLAPTAFFQALNQATLQTVSFTSLDLEAPDPQHITVKMEGVAQSVNSIALQAQIFSKNGVITSPIFSGIARNIDGVHFELSADVNPTALNYSQFVTAASASALPDQSSAPAGTLPSSGAPSASPFAAPAGAGQAAPAAQTQQFPSAGQ